jgi:hypothetical protein
MLVHDSFDAFYDARLYLFDKRQTTYTPPPLTNTCCCYQPSLYLPAAKKMPWSHSDLHLRCKGGSAQIPPPVEIKGREATHHDGGNNLDPIAAERVGLISAEPPVGLAKRLISSVVLGILEEAPPSGTYEYVLADGIRVFPRRL